MVGLAENIATQPSLAGAWAELGNYQVRIVPMSSCIDDLEYLTCMFYLQYLSLNRL